MHKNIEPMIVISSYVKEEKIEKYRLLEVTNGKNYTHFFLPQHKNIHCIINILRQEEIKFNKVANFSNIPLKYRNSNIFQSSIETCFFFLRQFTQKNIFPCSTKQNLPTHF